MMASALVKTVPDDEQRRSGHSMAGRPGILLELDPQAAFFVGSEIGVEHITTLVMDLTAKVLACRIEPFAGRMVSAQDAVEQAISQAVDGLSTADLKRVQGFGFAAPAQLDRNGHVRIAPLLGWRNVGIAALAREALPHQAPVMIENDANAFAFGESYRNHKAKTGVTLVLVIETGVGGGVVIDGKLFRGAHGLAGEIGHMAIRDRVELEHLLGMDNLLNRHKNATGLHETSLEVYLNDVRDRVPEAVEIAEEWAHDMARAIVAACRLLDPSRIVLGGSVAALYPMVAGSVAHHIAAEQASTFPAPEITVHEAAQTGAAYGAACMLHRRFIWNQRTDQAAFPAASKASAQPKEEMQ